MTIPTMALFARSLRLESRQLRFYLVRMGLLIITLFALMSAHERTASFGAPGLFFFQTIVYIDFFFITLAAIGYFASAIAEEKEEMTLGLLRMTSLSPVSILLGKSTSRLLGVVMFLAAQFPFVLLSITLGGVGLGQIVAAYCTLAAYIIFVSNLALFCSVLCQRSKNAGGLTFLLLMGFFLAPVLGPVILNAMGLYTPAPFGLGARPSGLVDNLFLWMYEASAFTRLMEILTTGFWGHPIGYQVISNLVLAAFFFFLAWRTFEFFTREQKQAAPSRGLVFTRASRLGRLGSRRAWSWPLVWKDFHFITGGVPAIIIKFIAYGVVLAIAVYVVSLNPFRQLNPVVIGWTIMWVMLMVIFFELCYHASRVFKAEINWKTLPAIMILPMSTRRIAYQKIAGCLIAMIPALAYFFLGVLMAPRNFSHAFVAAVSNPEGWFVIILVVFLLHLITFFSTIVKRGALALAVGITFVGIIFFGPFLTAMVFMGAAAVPCIILFFLSLVLHFLTGKRLEKVAAE